MKRILSSIVGCFLMGTGATAQTTTYSYTGTIESYTVPAGVNNISVEAWGAQGGNDNGGLGAYVYGEFTVTPGQTLNIVVGGQGVVNNCGGLDASGGGGGGSFVWDPASPSLPMVAAGAGGGGNENWAGGGCENGIDAPASEDGTSGGEGLAAGGVGGMGGDGDAPSGTGSGGGGWLSAGMNSTYAGGTSGCTGGETYPTFIGGNGGTGFGPGGEGGFGGGGGAVCGCGGGGGYSGGAGGNGSTCRAGGGGGGSYNAGTSVVLIGGNNTGDGQIIITELCTGLAYTVSDDTVCVGDEIILDASSTLGGTVSWDGGVTSGVAFTPPAGTTTYTATSTDPDDCEQTVTIFVGDLPTVDAGADQDVCEGDSVMVNASGTATDWAWDGGIMDGMNFLPPSGTTTYTVTGTIDSTGCQAMDMMDVMVVVPDVSITATGSSLMSNQAGADSYQWIDCHDFTPIAGETNQSYTPSVDGDYAVIVTLSGCVDTSACQASYLGITDLQDGTAPRVYPNPTDGQVTIFAKGTFSYQLMSPKGDVILQGDGKDSEELDMNELPAGVYMINVMTEFGVQAVKVIKK